MFRTLSSSESTGYYADVYPEYSDGNTAELATHDRLVSPTPSVCGKRSPTRSLSRREPSLSRRDVLWTDVTQPITARREESEPVLPFPKPDLIVMDGWLKKQGGNFKGWKERWCVMYNSGLFRYYSKGPEDTGELDEEYRKGKGDISFLELKTHGQDEQFFWIGTRKRMWNFEAKSKHEASRWLHYMTASDTMRREEEKLGLEFELSFEGSEAKSLGAESSPSVYYAPLNSPPMMSTIHKVHLSPSKAKQNLEFRDFKLRGKSVLQKKRFPLSIQTAFPDEVLKEGWLLKKGGKLGLWRRRYCVLRKSGIFRYYTEESCAPGARKGKGDSSFRLLLNWSQNGDKFTVETRERVWDFGAEDLQDASAWLHAFKMPYKLHRKAESMNFPSPSQTYTAWEPKDRISD